nr:ATP synthase F0 subunit 8 [Tenerus flavicollis]
MPQMSPMNWILLFLFFTMFFLLINSLNYFMNNSNSPKTLKTSFKKSINWKW